MILQQIADEALERELLIIVEELKAKHIELGQKASGKWVESLRVEVSNGNGFIYAEDYTEYLTKGRPSGKRPPISPIEEWVKVKLGKTGKEALNIAFAVATKIGKEGTEIYKDGGSDLLDGVITDERVRQMFTEVGRVLAFSIQEDLIRTAVS
jgi:hypothetical protein